MTENEAQKWLERFEWDDSEETSEALATICEVLQEYPKFKAIGTIEEFKALKEKSVAKKVQYDEYGKEEGYPYCSCGKCLIDDFVGASYCPNCGQKLDWQ